MALRVLVLVRITDIVSLGSRWDFLDHFYPSLLKVPIFLVEFVTHIVRVSIMFVCYYSPCVKQISFQVRKGQQVKDFFTIPEYEEWLENVPDAHKWNAKY